MFVHYITAIILAVVLTAHLLLHSPFVGIDLEKTLDFEYVFGNLKGYGMIFGLLLFAAVIHGVNGLRVLLLELSQNRGWNVFVNILTVILAVALLAIGLTTLAGVQA